MSSTQMSLSVDFYGLPLLVVGSYYTGTPERFNTSEGTWEPEDAPEFFIEHFSVEGLPEADAESLFTHIRMWDELEVKCLESVEELK